MSSINNIASQHTSVTNEAQCWSHIAAVLQHTSFPFDEAYVNQASVTSAIRKLCSANELPEAEAYLQTIVLLEWRARFLTISTDLYQSARGELTLVEHEEGCNVQFAKAYESCSTLTGDAIDLREIDGKAAPALRPVLGALCAEEGLPQGDNNYAEMAENVRTLLTQVVRDSQTGQRQTGNLDPLEVQTPCTYADLERLLEAVAAHILTQAIADAAQ